MLYLAEIYKGILLHKTLILIKQHKQKSGLTLVVLYENSTDLYFGLSKITLKIRPITPHFSKKDDPTSLLNVSHRVPL